MPNPFEIKAFDSEEELGDLAAMVKFANYHWQILRPGFTGTREEEDILGAILKKMNDENRRWIPLSSSQIDDAMGLHEKGYVRLYRLIKDPFVTVTAKTFFKISSELTESNKVKRFPMDPGKYVEVVEAFRNDSMR